MRDEDGAQFEQVIQDLCMAFNRPYTPELSRVFWESLKFAHIHDVKRAAVKWRDTAKKFPTPKDLKPEGRVQAPAPIAQDPVMSTWAAAANKILLALAYFDKRRGFVPIGDALKKVLVVKADYVRMAEEAEANGDTWQPEEFNRMCRQGFEKLLGTSQ